MPRPIFYSSLTACVLSLSSLVYAELSKPAAAPCTIAKSNCNCNCATANIDKNSPLLQNEFYPLWKQMDIQKAAPLLDKLIAQATTELHVISQLKAEEMSYANTFGAMEEAQDEAARCYMSIAQLNTVVDSPELRKVLEKMAATYAAFSSSIINNNALWKNLKIAAAQDWVATLSPAKKRHIQSSLDGFKDSGADLSPEQKKRRQEIVEELEKHQIKFEQNVQDSRAAWSLIIKDPAELAGLSPAWMEVAAQKALEKGHGSKENPQWMITLDYPSYGQVFTHGDHEASRKACWLAATSIATQEPFCNEPLVHRIAQLRQELAELLGFKNFASLKSTRRMIGGEPNMRKFIEGMIEQVKPSFKKESEEFLAFISEKKGKKLTQIAPWERHYYMNLLKEEQFQFNEEELRAYFPHEQVTQGMFSIFERLYNIRMEEKASYYPAKGEKTPADKAELWHPEIKVFEIFDASSDKHLGSFYLDLFQRDNKRGGAWMMPIRAGYSSLSGKPYLPNLGTVVCNFTRPVGDKQALLSHYEVRVLFHEMGHVLHLMLNETELRCQAGTNVAWDFVEFPSQISEYWTWLPESLDIFARHHETGAKIPDEIKKKLQKSQHFMPAMENMGQLTLAIVDLELHSQYDNFFKGKSLDEASARILKGILLPFSAALRSTMHSLTHCISGGYAGGYYGYKWSEVLAADGFNRFLQEGILNPTTGKQLRESVLSKGDSAPALELFKNFMGREPNSKALLEHQGLLPAKDKK